MSQILAWCEKPGDHYSRQGWGISRDGDGQKLLTLGVTGVDSFDPLTVLKHVGPEIIGLYWFGKVVKHSFF